MAVANFEEKTYETAYNVELATGVGGNLRIFSPGQVLEKLTGFDVAADADSKRRQQELSSLVKRLVLHDDRSARVLGRHRRTPHPDSP